MPRLCLAILLCCLSALAWGQPTVEVRILGIEGELADNARLYLSIVQQKDHPLLNDTRIQRLHEKAAREIASALKPFGYYRAEVSGRLLAGETSTWIAEYSVDKGTPLPVSELSLTLAGAASDDPAFAELQKTLPLAVGDPFDHRHYEEIKSSLARLAVERGYFDARFLEHVAEVDLDSYQARIYLYYDSGDRYQFGPVTLEQDILHPALMNRFVHFKEGDPYDVIALLDLQQALNDSNYFASVEVSPADTPSQGQVPIDVHLTPRKNNRYTFGIGYDTDTGARASAGWEKPRVNRRGHRFDTEIRATEIGYSINARYRIPVLNPVTDQIIYAAGLVHQTTETSDSTVRTLSTTLEHSVDKWRESVSLNYQSEHYEVADDRGHSVLLFPAISRSRVWGDEGIFSLSGLRLQGSLRGTAEKYLSTTPFLQGRVSIKGILPMIGGRLIGRWEGGATWTDTIHKLPASIRFFAGGAQSVRGYAYQSLGPIDSNGEVIGGRHLLVGSVEYDHPLAGNWDAAIFWDKGNAMDNLDTPLERGAGVGLRWKSPVGPIRFDVAWALSKPDRPWRLHINFGPDL